MTQIFINIVVFILSTFILHEAINDKSIQWNWVNGFCFFILTFLILWTGWELLKIIF